MHSIFKTTLLTLASLSICHASDSTKFNGEEVVFNEGEASVSFLAPKEHNGILFKIEDKSITVWGREFPKKELALNEVTYKKMAPEEEKIFKVIQNESIYIGVTGVAKCYAAFLKSNDGLKVEGHKGAMLNMTRTEVDSDVRVISPFINTSNFFVSTSGTVDFIAPISQQSWLESIVFSPSTTLDAPYQFCFDGTIKLSPPETFAGPFIALGAKKITFKLKKVSD